MLLRNDLTMLHLTMLHLLNCKLYYGPGFDSSSNEYQKYLLLGKGGRCVWLTSLPPSCADYQEILNSPISHPNSQGILNLLDS
jgi:hypothetical protein